MSTQHGGATSASTLQLYLLAIRGTLAPENTDAARVVHNATAGVPENVAAARALGDLSHMVYVPAWQEGNDAREFLILDIWQNLEGLNRFFANPQVQEQAGQIFSSRDPLVWVPADEFTSYHFPAPYGQDERYIGLIQGRVHSRAAAREQHNAIVAANLAMARQRGSLSHEAYFQLAPPDAPEALEFFAVDIWSSLSGMELHYGDPAFLHAFDGFFAAAPSTSTWQHPAGEWVEW